MSPTTPPQKKAGYVDIDGFKWVKTLNDSEMNAARVAAASRAHRETSAWGENPKGELWDREAEELYSFTPEEQAERCWIFKLLPPNAEEIVNENPLPYEPDIHPDSSTADVESQKHSEEYEAVLQKRQELLEKKQSEAIKALLELPEEERVKIAIRGLRMIRRNELERVYITAEVMARAFRDKEDHSQTLFSADEFMDFEQDYQNRLMSAYYLHDPVRLDEIPTTPAA